MKASSPSIRIKRDITKYRQKVSKRAPGHSTSANKSRTASRRKNKPKATTKTTRNSITIQPQSPLTIRTSATKVQCWAHTRAGRRCTNQAHTRENEPIPIPYCDKHLKHGDGALQVITRHPFAGKCLVARYDLPPNYRMVFWGRRGRCPHCGVDDRAISFYPPDKSTGRNRDEEENVRVGNYNGVLNPVGTGDLIQYAACPGPDERQNMRSTFQYWGIRNGQIGGLEFITLEAVPKNTQLCHWYGSGWWSARGIKRRNVGTKEHLAPIRRQTAKKRIPKAAK